MRQAQLLGICQMAGSLLLKEGAARLRVLLETRHQVQQHLAPFRHDFRTGAITWDDPDLVGPRSGAGRCRRSCSLYGLRHGIVQRIEYSVSGTVAQWSVSRARWSLSHWVTVPLKEVILWCS